MKVGTICKLNLNCLNNKAGTLGVVFNDYGDGFQVIFENGHYDGFSTLRQSAEFSEADHFLEEVGFEESLAGYKFQNVRTVSEDYRQGFFDRAWSIFWQKAAEQIEQAENREQTEQTCRICGCTDSKACEGGCSWVLPGICSKCVTREVPKCIELLVETIVQSHPDDYYIGEHKEETCSTCDLVKTARKIEAALRQ